jgi:deoxycytidylate deaminase
VSAGEFVERTQWLDDDSVVDGDHHHVVRCVDAEAVAPFLRERRLAALCHANEFACLVVDRHIIARYTTNNDKDVGGRSCP